MRCASYVVEEFARKGSKDGPWTARRGTADNPNKPINPDNYTDLKGNNMRHVRIGGTAPPVSAWAPAERAARALPALLLHACHEPPAAP